ncbi:MAG: DNA-binding protein [Acidobacteriota bacterium]|nr:DNA-binding protein [Acidobacteriota bacterium]
MPQLLVRNLDEKIEKALKGRAAKNGRSAEAEHRAILYRALAEDENSKDIKQMLLEIPDVGLDSDFDRPRDNGREIEF